MLTKESRKRDFPSLEGRVYLNTAAEGIPAAGFARALEQYARDKMLGMDGREAHFAREAAVRRKAAKLLGLKPEEVGFCSCSAEAYNLLASALDLKAEDEVVISDLDFPSGATPWLAGWFHPTVRLWKSREGVLELDDLAGLLNEKTRLVQVSLVSFYNGWRLPWGNFQTLVRERAPRAVLSVDITQALGRCVLDCQSADILISSTHKWILGPHGSCIVGVPSASAERVTTRAGGWYHLQNAFDADRFERAEPKMGAASYSVGMPNFGSLYALDAAIEYILEVGVENIARHADPLVARMDAVLRERGIVPLAPWNEKCGSGILAFRHERSEQIHAVLKEKGIHIMHHAGRLRLSFHGYNSMEDVETAAAALDEALKA